MRGDAHKASGHHAAPREAEERIDAFAAELLLPRAVVGRRRRRTSGPPACPAHGSWPAPGPGTSSG